MIWDAIVPIITSLKFREREHFERVRFINENAIESISKWNSIIKHFNFLIVALPVGVYDRNWHLEWLITSTYNYIKIIWKKYTSLNLFGNCFTPILVDMSYSNYLTYELSIMMNDLRPQPHLFPWKYREILCCLFIVFYWDLWLCLLRKLT